MRRSTSRGLPRVLGGHKGRDKVNRRLLVALGSTAAQGLLGFRSFKALGDVRGRWHDFGGKPLMVTYHPSYILRNQSNRSKRMYSPCLRSLNW